MGAERGPPRSYLAALAIALLLALLPMPYGYYQLLKLLSCGLGAWAAFGEWRSGRIAWAGFWVVFTAAYNPVFPLYLGRNVWMIVNVASAAFIVLAIYVNLASYRAASKKDASVPGLGAGAIRS